jgi:hypothetical protein
MPSPPTPIKVSPQWRVVPKRQDVVAAHPQRPLMEREPVVPAEWHEVPAPQPYIDDDFEVPTGRHAVGATRYTRQAPALPRPQAGPSLFIPGVCVAGMLVGAWFAIFVVFTGRTAAPAAAPPPPPATPATAPYTPRPTTWRCT